MITVVSYYFYSPLLTIFRLDGNLKPYVKSEPIPEVNNEPVKVVVRDNIQDLVFNSVKNGRVVQYQGDRTKEDLIEFVQKNRDTNAKPFSVMSDPSIKLELAAKSESGYLFYRWS
ncbi:hypothetical protein AgCh_029002 [Apium graveolens]